MSGPLSDRNRLTFALAAAAIILVAGLMLGLANERARHAERVRELGIQADILSASVTAALAFDDRPAAAEYVTALRVNPELEAAGVYDEAGALFAGFSRRGALPARLGETADDVGAVVVTRTVSEDGPPLGQVVIAAGAEPLSALLRRQGGTALLVVMATLFLAVLGRAYATLDRRAKQLAEANEALRLAAQERDQAEEALVQAKKMEAVGQLTGGIAHDFNNLLQAINGSLDLIVRKPGDEDRVLRLAQVGLQAGERGRQLTSQLLAFSRAPQLKLKVVHVGDLIAGMSSLLTSTVGPMIRLELELDVEPTPVLADPVQLEMAVLNLAVNARDVMPEGGALKVSLQRRVLQGDKELPDDLYLELCVSDTGPGMPDEVRARAFEPFFTTKGVGRGTGLGLAQVYAVARQSGGAARIRSEAGQGTAVSLLLRRVEGAAVAGALGPDTAPIRAVADGRHVLVVDDDAQVRTQLRESLEALGHKVDEAEDAAAATAALELNKPDLMLVDFAMPVVNGAELAAAVRRRWPDLPIVFASGYADGDQVEAALGPSAPLLRKPFSIHELGAAVEKATRKTA